MISNQVGCSRCYLSASQLTDRFAVRKFKIFNTNNLWINLKGNPSVSYISPFSDASGNSSEESYGGRGDGVGNYHQSQSYERRASRHTGTNPPDHRFDTLLTLSPQLETAAGAAIKHFRGATSRNDTKLITADTQNVGHGVNVPRSRFLPVKSCSDLLLIKSDIYSLEHGNLVLNPTRVFDTIPVIKLSDHFKKVSPAPLPAIFVNILADSPVPEEVQEDPAHR